MKFRLQLALCFTAWLASPALAFDWEIHRAEGRDYVALSNVAEFYKLTLPPLIERTPLQGPPAPSLTSDSPGFAPPPSSFDLTSERDRLTLTVNSREAVIDGVKQWLAFPILVQDGKSLVSRLDLSKIIEPRMRPEKISGMGPVETVVLDAGHGGHDRGASSRYGFEKDFALDVVMRARDLLLAQRYKVVLTRAADVFVPLEERAAIANRIPNSIFVSIHFNSSSSNADARGFEIFSIAPRGAPATNDPGFSERDLREEPGNGQDLPSAALACTVYHSLVGQVPTFDRGLKVARFAVLRRCTVPAVLVECGFVSNNAESALISSSTWRRKVAEAVVEGVDNYKGLAERGQRPKVVADYRNGAPSAPQ